MDNTPRPTPTLNNTTKVSISETWGSITSTWGSETRTWLGTISVIGNTTRPVSSMNNTPKP